MPKHGGDANTIANGEVRNGDVKPIAVGEVRDGNWADPHEYVRTRWIDKDIARTLESALISPNVLDYNLEPANIVDALAQIADALRTVARAIDPDIFKPAPLDADDDADKKRHLRRVGR
jgi:hypothetical protein